MRVEPVGADTRNGEMRNANRRLRFDSSVLATRVTVSITYAVFEGFVEPLCKHLHHGRTGRMASS